MIVRLMGEGQYRLSDDLLARLDTMDNRAAEALERDDEEELRFQLEQMGEAVRSEGERLDDADLHPSDLLIPPSDLSLEEAHKLFEGEGLIPDLPIPEGTVETYQQLRRLPVAEAVDRVVVDQPGCLHEGVEHRRTDERKPRRFMSLDMARDSSVSAGSSASAFHAFWRGCPPTNDQT